jgi:hypothetical protein
MMAVCQLLKGQPRLVPQAVALGLAAVPLALLQMPAGEHVLDILDALHNVAARKEGAAALAAAKVGYRLPSSGGLGLLLDWQAAAAVPNRRKGKARAAVRAAGSAVKHTGVPDVVQLLGALLEGKAAARKLPAARASSWHGGLLSPQVLLPLEGKRWEPGARIYAGQLLLRLMERDQCGEQASAAALGPLVQLLMRGADVDVQAYAAEALAGLSVDDAVAVGAAEAMRRLAGGKQAG